MNNTLYREALTEREFEVLQLAAAGLTGKQIASILCVSHKTARTHLDNILSKFYVHNRATLVAYVVINRIVDHEYIQEIWTKYQPHLLADYTDHGRKD